MNKAPWKDFAGGDIYEGDVIIHPTGDSGLVIFKSEYSDPADQWRVDYDDGGPFSRLCLQIGNKGQAVAHRSALSAGDGHGDV